MDSVKEFDLSGSTIRDVNAFLHGGLEGDGLRRVEILNPDGGHSIAVGLNAWETYDGQVTSRETDTYLTFF